MSKQYKIDGGDPNAKGYVCENRMANQQATDALQKEGSENAPSDGEGSVYVLTIYKDEQFFPCVHKSLEGAIHTAIADMKEGMEDEGDYNFPLISKVLYEQMYWKDELSGAVYDIAECKVFA